VDENPHMFGGMFSKPNPGKVSPAASMKSISSVTTKVYKVK
jgi:hypothetical protein